MDFILDFPLGFKGSHATPENLAGLMTRLHNTTSIEASKNDQLLICFVLRQNSC